MGAVIRSLGRWKKEMERTWGSSGYKVIVTAFDQKAGKEINVDLVEYGESGSGSGWSEDHNEEQYESLAEAEKVANEFIERMEKGYTGVRLSLNGRGLRMEWKD